MAEPRRIYCTCTGCSDFACNALEHTPCNRNRQWSSRKELEALGWTRGKKKNWAGPGKGAWLCPGCAGKRARYSSPSRRVEPASDPIWQERGAQLLEFLKKQPRAWAEMQKWAVRAGYGAGMLRHIMASVDEYIVYHEKTWSTVWRRASLPPIEEPGPGGLSGLLPQELLQELAGDGEG